MSNRQIMWRGRTAWIVSAAISLVATTATRAADVDVPRTSAAATSPDRAKQKGLMIIVPTALKSGVEKYAAYKDAQLPTRIVELETALKTEGVDDPERLKRFLFVEWKAGSVGYVLLVGDADVLPVRYMTLDRNDEKAFNYSFYPCDLYYADLAKRDGSFDDWNAQKDDFHARYFGEVRGEHNKSDPINFDQVDYHPDVAVGRWPVSKAEDAERVARKSMAYEARHGADEKSTPPAVSMFAVGGWVDMRHNMDGFATSFGDRWTVTKQYYADKRRDDKTPPPSQDNVIAAFNAGTDLILHAGHGSDDRWEQSFDIRNLNKVHNATKLGVVMSAGCSTARFATLPPYEPYRDVDGNDHTGSDNGERFTAPPTPPSCYQKGKFNRTGLGERLVVENDDGAAAYIGCNTGSQPWGLTLMEGFATRVASGEPCRLGDAWNAAVEHYIAAEHLPDLKPNDDWTPPAIYFQAMKFMVFGDPSLKMPVVGR